MHISKWCIYQVHCNGIVIGRTLQRLLKACVRYQQNHAALVRPRTCGSDIPFRRRAWRGPAQMDRSVNPSILGRRRRRSDRIRNAAENAFMTCAKCASDIHLSPIESPACMQAILHDRGSSCTVPRPLCATSPTTLLYKIGKFLILYHNCFVYNNFLLSHN